MEKRFRTSILILLCLFSIQVWAQEREISGTITDESGLPLPGVNVIEKNSSNGTVTDFDGNFKLTITGGDETILVFSSLGFVRKEIVIGDKNTLEVSMFTDTESLNEVVVTAFGIERQEKALGYAVQEVNSEEILEGNKTNVVSGLQGKVSGVTISNSGGAPGSSTAILIRGGTSITGNNQPLFVVDGIPIDNSTSSSLTVASINRAADLNPEDIENVSVLKGPAAAALYGIQAAEGAVIITTKKGKAGVSTISYSGTFSVDEVLGTPEVQQQFGQGTQILSTDGFSYEKESNFSWGSVVENQETYNHIEDFYETAITQNHNVSYSGGTESSTMYLSIGDLSQDGVIEGTNYDKTSFKINTTSKLGDKLTVGASANYVVTEVGSTKQGNASGSSYSSLLSYPINIDIQNFYAEDGSQRRFYEDQTFDNPYWSIENSPNDNKVNRLIGIVNLSYDFLNDFNLSYKLGTDYFSETSKRVIGTGSLIENRSEGYISQFQRENRKTTSNLILSYSKAVSEDFEIDALVGNMVEDYKVHSVYTYGDGFQAPGIYSIGNVSQENQSITELITRRRAVGVFGEVKFGWKDALFLNFTGRNDWSSTLPEDKRSFFYPSIGTSAVITDLFEQAGNDITSDNGLSFMKFRATWAQAGKDAPIGALNSFLGTNINPLASSAYTYNGVDIGNPALEPEFTDSYEAGIDARFFKNRLGLDLSVYYSKSKNQILEDIRVPPSAGTFYATLNGGSIINKGIEALVTAKLFERGNAFQWNMTYNFGLNKSDVIELPGQLDEVYLSDSWTFSNTAAGAAILNGSLFGLRGYQAVRNDQQELIIGADGLPELETVIFEDVNRLPDWTLGFTNNLSYKNFNFSFLLDLVQGQEAYNATKSAFIYYGLGEETLDRSSDGVRVVEGVLANGQPNTTQVTDQQYYQQYYSQNAENFIEDASFARLRYATLSYDVPTALLEKLNMVSAQISITGRNLFTITDYSGVDPEVNTYGAGIQGAGSMGIDNLGTPNTKGFDLGLRFKF
ncbi:TonB-linked outer membrane protein, SusC/RagA family [Salegentibacter holothuriorum]|uniref:TonB-linked outer membrane protein, SusC/RagA family n=1 Tax=Salegentibacter holothuriorum TaxID=241145 RepID=A0A1T5BWJ6_9FLAO|nr:SusC/RagA family TonB-linked outer membrane protein [Salegentibacter holothuriorum]SKB51514.1 TonB-linked outer membrane protein, SusC/RagA family [Salegentibacter holothuriorum]